MAEAIPPCCAREASKGAEDDFFCLRFQVWYPSIDCAYRTRWHTCGACAHCDQGRFNLKRHAAAIARMRPHRHAAPEGR